MTTEVFTQYSVMSFQQFIDDLEINKQLDPQQVTYLRQKDQQIDKLIDDIVDTKVGFDQEVSNWVEENDQLERDIKSFERDLVRKNKTISNLEEELKTTYTTIAMLQQELKLFKTIKGE